MFGSLYRGEFSQTAPAGRGDGPGAFSLSFLDQASQLTHTPTLAGPSTAGRRRGRAADDDLAALGQTTTRRQLLAVVASRVDQLLASLAAGLQATPEALRAAGNVEEVLLRALLDASGDVEEVRAEVETNAQAFLARWSLEFPSAALPDVCVLCSEAIPFIPWGCGHATCVDCTLHAAGTGGSNATPGRGDSVTRPAPQLGTGMLLPAASRVLCPAVTTPPCPGFLPSMRRLTYLHNDAGHALRGALETERLLAVGVEPGPAQRWRACNSCPLYNAVDRNEQQSAACTCGHITCLDGGAMGTNCDGDGHDGLSCAAAHTLREILQAWTPRFEAVAIVRRQPQVQPAPAAPAAPAPRPLPSRDRLPELLHSVRNLDTLSAEPEAVARLTARLHAARHWPLPEGDDAFIAAAEEVVRVLDEDRVTRHRRVLEQASQLSRDAVTAVNEAVGRAQAALATIASGGTVADARRSADAAIADAEAAFVFMRRLYTVVRSGGCGLAMLDAMLAEEAQLAGVEASIPQLKASLASAVAGPMAEAPALTEAAATEAYLLSESRPCPTPGCGAQLQKIDGCNALAPCPNCQRSCCWSCLGPVHDHGTNPCSNSDNRALIMAAIQAAGHTPEAAQRQADAMAAADADVRQRQSSLVVALRRNVGRLESDLLPGDMERALAPLRAAVRLAKLSVGSPEAESDMAMLRAMVSVVYHDCCAGHRMRGWHDQFFDDEMVEERRMLERRERMRMRLRQDMRRVEEPQAAPIIGDEEVLRTQLPARYAADVSADHDPATSARERSRNNNLYQLALQAATALGATPADVPAAASRLAAAFCANKRAQECTRRLALPLLALGPGTTQLHGAQRAAFAALRRAAEAERSVHLALLPTSVVTPAVQAEHRLLEAAERCGSNADALMARLAAGVEPERVETIRFAAEALTAMTEALLSGPGSLIARCGGVEAARARALVAMQPRTSEMEQ